MKTFKSTIMYVVIALSIVLTACEDRDSDKILPGNPVFQGYLVRYDLTNKKTIAKAIFRTIDYKGTRLNLKGKSSIKMNGHKHSTYNNLLESYSYHWEAQKGLLDVKFAYVKNGKKTFTNTFKRTDAPKVDFELGHKHINLKKDNKIVWTGGALKSGESIFIKIIQGKSIASAVVSSKGATSLVFKKGSLKDFKAGKAKIYLRKTLVKNNIKQADGKGGGKISYETEISTETMLK